MVISVINVQTHQEISQISFAVNQLAANWKEGQGATVIRDDNGNAIQVVGKNAATGEDAPNKTGTTAWDIPRQAPDGSWYIIDPANDPRFVDWRQYIPPGITIPEAVPMPESWDTAQQP